MCPSRELNPLIRDPFTGSGKTERFGPDLPRDQRLDIAVGGHHAGSAGFGNRMSSPRLTVCGSADPGSSRPEAGTNGGMALKCKPYAVKILAQSLVALSLLWCLARRPRSPKRLSHRIAADEPAIASASTHLGGWGRVSDSGAAICVACWWLAALPASLNPNSLLSWEKYREIHQFWPPTSEFPFEITRKISSLHDEFPALCNRQ